MRAIFATIVVTVGSIGHGAGFAAVAAPQFKCEVNGEVHFDTKSCRAALKRAENSLKPRRQMDAALVVKKAPSGAGPAAAQASPLNPPANYATAIFVRRSFDDLGSFANPSKLAKAAGAEFSWARDGVINNDTWTARGLVAARLLTWESPAYTPYLDHSLLGAYVQFDRVSNSKLKTKDVNDLTFGFFNEIAFANFLQATHYLTTRAEIVTDFDGKAKNWDVNWEYAPYGGLPENANTIFAYLGTPLTLSKYFFLTVTPKARAEYRGSLDGATDPIFATHNHVFRAGPAVTVAIDGNSVFDDVPWFIRGTHFQVTYGWLYDTVANANYRLLDTSLTFNLDPKDRLGVTLSYRRGELETTGARVDLAKVALSAKFGE